MLQASQSLQPDLQNKKWTIVLVVLHGPIHPKTFEATDIYPKQSGGLEEDYGSRYGQWKVCEQDCEEWKLFIHCEQIDF